MEPAYTITNNDELLAALHPVPNFESRDDIKPWLHSQLDPRGICLVIERSDASKVVFKCKSIYKKSSKKKSITKMSNGKMKKIRSQPEESCPFRLRVSYSVKQKQWSVIIIKPDHNPAICSNFGIHRGSATSTPTNRSTTKRSWTSAYTPASTTSPMMSFHGSPATTLTPASEMDSLEFDRFNKKQKQSYESPLSHVIDPLDPLQLPEDLSDLKYIEQEQKAQNQSFPLDVLNTENIDSKGTFNMEFNTNSFAINHHDGLSGMTQFDAEKLFELDIKSKVSNMITDEDLFKTVYNEIPHDTIEPQTHLIAPQLPSSTPAVQNSSLNINTDIHLEEDADSLMYLLSASNSNYTLEELENLDKAMGVDANDKFLLSMFHQND